MREPGNIVAHFFLLFLRPRKLWANSYARAQGCLKTRLDIGLKRVVVQLLQGFIHVI